MTLKAQNLCDTDFFTDTGNGELHQLDTHKVLCIT